MKTDYKSRVRVIEAQTTVKVIPGQIGRTINHKETALKRVCAYCRVSTEQEQQQSSYNLQVSYYTDFIKKNKMWEFSGVYADEGISGTSIKNRTNFIRMIEDCEAGKIDLILTKSISRFARNTLDCLNYVRKLKALSPPVGVYYEKENIDTLDAKSELLLTILSSLAQDESRNISENVRWAIQKRYQKGEAHCPTNNFLGYDTNANGDMVINEEQAKAVKRIYSEGLAGNGSSLIANRLTADGVKTGKGYSKWCGNSVYRILRNEKYCGDILMQKRVTIDFLTHKRAPNTGQQPQYFIADHHPAIITKEDWNAMQIELNRRSNINKSDENGIGQRHSNRTVFSNVLYCGTCGEPSMRKTLTSSRNGKKYLYPVWKCRAADGRVKKMECHAKSYREEAIEHTFMTMLQEMKYGHDELSRESEIAIADIDLDEWEKDRMEFLNREIPTLEEHLSQVASSAQSSIASEVYDDMSLQLAQEIETFQNELEELNEKNYEVIMIKRNLIWLLEQLDEIEDFDPASERIEFREDIFRRIVKKGEVFNDGSIIYELSSGGTWKSKENGMAIWKIKKGVKLSS